MKLFELIPTPLFRCYWIGCVTALNILITHGEMLGMGRYIIFTSSAPGYVFQEENVFLVSYKWERVLDVQDKHYRARGLLFIPSLSTYLITLIFVSNSLLKTCSLKFS